MGAGASDANVRHAQTQLRELQAKNATLQRDLSRKDRALAETAALLVLQKKVPGAVGGRGEMIALQQRQTLLALIGQACQGDARLHKACAVVGLAARTVQRWLHPAAALGDRRTPEQRTPHVLANKFTEAKRQVAMDILSSNAFKDLPPSQIVPRLADLGTYVGSESTLYRLLRQAGQLAHRRLERAPHKRSKPRALVATAPDQIYCWDITYLPTQVRAQHFYLYLFEDLFSRKAVGWQVFDCESAELASQLLQDICHRAGIKPDQLTVHSDNGGPMKGQTMLTTLQELGVAHSRSRPAVSNDNPYSESLFKTLKYRPQLPVKPFEDLLAARQLGHRIAALVQRRAPP
jgi:transposase InsO family protein